MHTNAGFAGGCNAGLELPGRYDVVALINNDATVEPGWLQPLVEALDADRHVGAACPKILFGGTYLSARLDGNDVVVHDVRVDGAPGVEHVRWGEGFDSAAGDRLVSGRGEFFVDVRGATSMELSVLVSSAGGDVRLVAGDQIVVAGSSGPSWLDVSLTGAPFDLVNNVGSELYPRGFGGDRGFMEPDVGQYDAPTEVFAWCGAAVALAAAYLEDVGQFDERLFLYYEDFELSWRGRLRGWSYRFVPESVVRHRHAATSRQGSDVFEYFTQRNRPLVLARSAPPRMAWRAGLGLAQRYVRGVIRVDGAPRDEAGDLPRRVLIGYLARLPGTVRYRWLSRTGRRQRTQVVERWQTTRRVTTRAHA